MLVCDDPGVLPPARVVDRQLAFLGVEEHTDGVEFSGGVDCQTIVADLQSDDRHPEPA